MARKKNSGFWWGVGAGVAGLIAVSYLVVKNNPAAASGIDNAISGRRGNRRHRR
jgi:hypothetical protein